MHRSLLAVLTALALLIAACGDDADNETSASTSTTVPADGSDADVGDVDGDSESGEAADPESPATNDQAVAEAAVLTLDDFPSGWTAAPVDEETEADQDEFDQHFADCLGVPVEEVQDRGFPSAESDTFTGPNDEEISNEVIVSPTQEENDESFERFESDAFVDCLAEVFGALMEQEAEGQDFEVVDLAVERLQVSSNADRTAAIRVTVTLSAEETEIETYLDFIAAGVGRATTTMLSMALFTPTDIAFVGELLNKSVDRIDRHAVT